MEELDARLFTGLLHARPESGVGCHTAGSKQQICYALSSDGIDFVPLNGGHPVIASDSIAVMKGVRDPHILRGTNGWFYMVATDMDWTKGKWSNRGIVMMRSQNLLDWDTFSLWSM